jgi:hypothetical protein
MAQIVLTKTPTNYSRGRESTATQQHIVFDALLPPKYAQNMAGEKKFYSGHLALVV